MSANLASLAWVYSQNLTSELTATQFKEALQGSEHVDELEALTQSYAPYEEITIPVHLRLLELEPDSLGRLVRLGFAYWMNGHDEVAQDCATRALAVDRGNIEALNLQAALAKDDALKKSIYARILTIDPKNRAAFDNLVLLRATSR